MKRFIDCATVNRCRFASRLRASPTLTKKNEMKLGSEGKTAIATCGSNGIGWDAVSAAGRI
jgi:hypothetical protein